MVGCNWYSLFSADLGMYSLAAVNAVMLHSVPLSEEHLAQQKEFS
jgi:hypothetical protein